MIDLFAGCGGLSLGMESAGFVPIFVNELHDDARATYLANRRHSIDGVAFNQRGELHSADVHELNCKTLPIIKSNLINLGLLVEEDKGTSLDLICGGPPCQGYSGIGHRRSYRVDKKAIPSNQLYQKMAEIVEFFKPKVFLFENVKGLLSSRWTSTSSKGDIWRDVWSRFNAISDYEIHWSLVSSKDYGVPQNRPRVLLVGYRHDVLKKAERSGIIFSQRKRSTWDSPDAIECGFLPLPTQDYPQPTELLSDLIDPSIALALETQAYPKTFATPFYPHPARTKWQKYLRTWPGEKAPREKGTPVSEHEYSKHSERVVAKFSAMRKGNGAIPEEFRTKKFAQRLLPYAWPSTGPNITATSLPDDFVHFSQPRTLTVREWARLQTFPDWYQFEGKRTTGGIRRAGNPQAGIHEREVPKYTQIGNAVPVKLAAEVGDHFKRILESS